MEESRLDELDLVSVKVEMSDGGGGRQVSVREVLEEVSGQIEPVDGVRDLLRDPAKVQIAAVEVLLERSTGRSFCWTSEG